MNFLRFLKLPLQLSWKNTDNNKENNKLKIGIELLSGLLVFLKEGKQDKMLVAKK
jgi:hypothetical protein